MEQGRAEESANPRAYIPTQDRAEARGWPPATAPDTPADTFAVRVPEQVRRHSVRAQVLDALRTALADGDLVPGEVYSAPVLGGRFGVSATPVREAMQRLAAEGAVEVVPNRGYRVAERGAGELAELAEVRTLIELPVLVRLARTEPTERWAALRPLADEAARTAAAGDHPGYFEQDAAFHRAVLSLAGNRQLLVLAEDLHRRAHRPPAAGAPVPRANLVADAADHTALLDALEARDVTTVAALVRDHLAGVHS